MARPRTFGAVPAEPVSDIDLRAIGSALKARRRAYLVPTLIAFVLISLYVNVTTSRYTAQTQILLENQENFFTRPDRVNLPPETASQLDEAAVASQVQLINSPDIARRAIEQLKLAGNDEFDPSARGLNPLSRALVLLGVLPDPTRASAESRMVETFLQKLTVFSPPKTRVITIEFTSRDPALAARAANTIAELYIQEQSAAKRAMAQAAAEALSAQIVDLRVKLAKADGEREQYRSTSGLLAGNGNLTISGQQLADINGELSKARTAQADSQAKASLIRELVRAGKTTDVADVTNNDIVRRIYEQRAVAQAQLASESRTLLPGHPRIKEMTAQVAQYDTALKGAAKQAETTLENEAKIAGQRVANLETILGQQKKAAGVSNGDEVHLRALERIAQSYKDQLESSTTKYEEAMARQSSRATPADARIISRATRPQWPSFPKKVPFIIFGTVATLVFAIGYVIADELLSGRATVEAGAEATSDEDEVPLPFAPPPRGARTRMSNDAPPRRATGTDAAAGQVDETGGDLVFAAADRKSGLFSGLAAGALLAKTVDYAKHFGRSAAQSRAPEDVATEHAAPRTDGDFWDLEPATPVSAGASRAERDAKENTEELAERIVAAHVPGRGLHIVGASTEGETLESLLSLSRTLAEKGRSLIVDLNTTPMKLAALSDAENGRAKIMTMKGLSELLAGRATFAEVIYRDHASRLHFIPTGHGDADFGDFDLILDALSETYDFIVLLTPAFPRSEIAKVMAPFADFVVLTATDANDHATIETLEAELIEAGARNVLVTGPAARGVRLTPEVA